MDMEDMEFMLEFITELYMPIIMGLCLGVGYILKHWIKDVNNKIIPTILAILGVAVALLTSPTPNLQVIVGGLLSGLASTGMHQAFKNLIEKE